METRTKAYENCLNNLVYLFWWDTDLISGNKTTDVAMNLTPVADDTGTKIYITTNLTNGTSLIIAISKDATSYSAHGRSSTLNDVKKQRVYPNYKYIYLHNGVVIIIQD